MTDYYSDIRALIDPEQFDPLPGGGRTQEISVIMTDNWDGPAGHQLPPSGCTLTPDQARALAFELLVLAEHAQRIGGRR